MGATPAIQNNQLSLASGEALTITETRQITRKSETSLVTLVGSPSSGKTTLIASLFHCFQRGPFANFLFAGSNTCLGLDRRCHLGRTTSRGVSPDMERTKLSTDKNFIHFRVKEENLHDPARDILITDISGEQYENLRHSFIDCRDFPLFKRADHIVLLVDGERISDASQRHASKIEAEQFLGFLRDAGHCNDCKSIYVLIAKCDIINTDDARSFVNGLKSDILAEFKDSIPFIFIDEVAARPRRISKKHDLGFGIDKYLNKWSKRSECTAGHSPIELISLCHSEFDRFILRQDSNQLK